MSFLNLGVKGLNGITNYGASYYKSRQLWLLQIATDIQLLRTGRVITIQIETKLCDNLMYYQLRQAL